MGNDWKNALSALRDSFEPLEEPNEKEDIKEPESEEIKQKDKLKVLTDKKGRNGKIATIIEGFTINQEKVAELARELKQKIGVGGSIREGEILIQGDHKDKIIKFLQSKGFKC